MEPEPSNKKFYIGFGERPFGVARHPMTRKIRKIFYKAFQLFSRGRHKEDVIALNEGE